MSYGGGRHYRWVVLVLAWAAFTMTSADRSIWGPASATVADHLGVSLAAVGTFATGYYLGYVVSNAGGGVLTDRFGPRLTMAASLSAAGVALTLFGRVHSVVIGVALQAAVGPAWWCSVVSR